MFWLYSKPIFVVLLIIKQRTMKLSGIASHFLYITALLVCFLPFVTPVMALSLGLVFSVLNIHQTFYTKYTSLTLQVAIVLMGFGMNLTQVIETSKTGFSLTAGSVILTLTVGLLLGRLFKVDGKITMLIAAGTAICGGSAIAAVSPVIQAKNNQISFALMVVFVLNAFALFTFPVIGHWFNMSQHAFGLWSAIAIHDTSSVVGAAATYGNEALEIATTVKLTRALWIIPVSLVLMVVSKKGAAGKVKIPWFIGLFVLAILVSHYLPMFEMVYSAANLVGHKGMVVALFLIGSSISMSEVKKAGVSSFILGITLWISISVVSFVVIQYC